jgi:hypothetical protein
MQGGCAEFAAAESRNRHEQMPGDQPVLLSTRSPKRIGRKEREEAKMGNDDDDRIGTWEIAC